MQIINSGHVLRLGSSDFLDFIKRIGYNMEWFGTKMFTNI